MERRSAGLQVAFALLAACGGASDVAAPARPPPAAVLALQVAVHAGGSDDNFCQPLELGLARSGIPIVAEATAPDVLVTCHPYVSADDSVFHVEVNGRPRVQYTVRVEVRAAQTNALVDQFVAEYKGYRGGAADEDAVAKAVIGFAYSPRMAAFARAVQRARSAGAPVETAPPPTATAEQPPPPRNDARDDADWFAIDTVKCKIPARVEACDPVRRYLQRHPNGAHAEDANAILAAAQPALEKLQKDEIAWNKSNHSECASRRTSDACIGVEAYEIQFPTGIHAEVAHRMLKAAGVDK